MIKTLLAVLLIVASLPLFAMTTSLSGETVVRSIAPDRVAVFIDTNGDRLIDQGFLLSADIPTGRELAVRFASASIEFTDGYVRVVADDRFYDLVVAGYPDPPQLPAESRVTTLIGYSLVQSKGDSGCSVDRAHQQDAGSCFSYGQE